METLLEFGEILKTPMVALYAGIWVIGLLLKNYTSLNNKFIPWIAVALSIGLSLVLIEVSIPAGILGAVLGLVLVGGHSFGKNGVLEALLKPILEPEGTIINTQSPISAGDQIDPKTTRPPPGE